MNDEVIRGLMAMAASVAFGFSSLIAYGCYRLLGRLWRGK